MTEELANQMRYIKEHRDFARPEEVPN